MDTSWLRIPGIFLACVLALQGCSDVIDEDEELTSDKKSTNTMQQKQPAPMPPQKQVNGYNPGHPQSPNQQAEPQFGNGYGRQYNPQSGTNYMPSQPYHPPAYGQQAAQDRGDTGSPHWGAPPVNNSGQNRRQRPGGYQPPGQSAYRYRPLETLETKNKMGNSHNRSGYAPAPPYPRYMPPGGLPGGAGYSPYGGYVQPLPGYIGIPPVAPGVW